MRGKCQMVNVMHFLTQIISYEIFTDEVDWVEGEEDGGWGEVSTGLAGGE